MKGIQVNSVSDLETPDVKNKSNENSSFKQVPNPFVKTINHSVRITFLLILYNFF